MKNERGCLGILFRGGKVGASISLFCFLGRLKFNIMWHIIVQRGTI